MSLRNETSVSKSWNTLNAPQSNIAPLILSLSKEMSGTRPAYFLIDHHRDGEGWNSEEITTKSYPTGGLCQ